jgi:hypothetical protein
MNEDDAYDANEELCVPTAIVTTPWNVVESTTEFAGEAMTNIEASGWEVRHVNTVVKPDGTTSVFIYTRSTKGMAMKWKGTVKKGGYYTSDCACAVKIGLQPPEELGPCPDCFRNVSWSYEPFKHDSPGD